MNEIRENELSHQQQKNRYIGLGGFGLGILLFTLPWIITFKFGEIYPKFNATLIALSPSIILLSLRAVIFPPSVPLNSQENQQTSAKLTIIGLLISCIVVYFFNYQLGIW